MGPRAMLRLLGRGSRAAVGSTPVPPLAPLLSTSPAPPLSYSSHKFSCSPSPAVLHSAAMHQCHAQRIGFMQTRMMSKAKPKKNSPPPTKLSLSRMLTLQHAVLLKQKFKEFPVPKGWTNVNTMEHLSPGEPDYYVLKRTDGDFTLTLLTSSTVHALLSCARGLSCACYQCIVNMSDVDEDLDDEPQAEEEEEDEESYGLSMLLALERPGSKKFKSTSLKHFVDLNPPVQNAIQQAIAKHLSPELLNYLLEVRICFAVLNFVDIFSSQSRKIKTSNSFNFWR
eukprot:750457-Hanusia_phi.AAC.4